MKLIAQSVLLEGITHIEDLPLQDFIHAVETLKDKTVTEKLDGSNLWFGVDDKGFFTSREGKSRKGTRFYNVSDYPAVAAYNGFRGAHEALARHADIIKRHLQPGDMVEVEVLFGRQPNTVTYGNDEKNFIVILRGIDTDQKKVNALAKALNGKSSKINSTVITSDDGENLKQEDVQQQWEFTQVKPLDTKKVDLGPAMERLAALKKYLAQPNTKVQGKTNQEVAEISLNKVPKEDRDVVKAEREAQLAYIMKNFKEPIKKFLLDVLVRKVKPFLQTKDVTPDEDIGVEGVVASDKKGNMIKIVDKDMFTAINTFNNYVRNNIAGLVRTDDKDAPIEMRGGAFGEAKLRIANLLGMKELAMSSSSRKILSKFKGADAAETARNIADNIHLASFESVRKKTSAILENAIEEIDGILQNFKDNADTYKLKLETGKEIGISPEVMKRTLTAFAETKRDINQINTAVLKSRDLPEMIMALYGRTIQGLFSGDQEVKESLFKTVVKLTEGHEFKEGDKYEVTSDFIAVGTGRTKVPVKAGTIITINYANPQDDSRIGFTHEGRSGLSANAATLTGKTKRAVKEDEAGAAAAADGTTSAGDIAPVEKRLMGGRMITRRPRKFVKKKKFAQMKEGASLLQILEFDMGASTGIQNQFAKDVDDTVAAKNDIEFKGLRNQMKTSGDQATQQDVVNYLDKAHELNDEVDTVTFGMEMDDGSVVKVYVNATQADAFEKALGELLGEEDDVEEVIDQLANNFDIVDVEWPDGAQDQTGDALVAVDQNNEITGDSTEPTEDGQIDSEKDANGVDQVNPVIDLSPEGGEDEQPDGEQPEGEPSLMKQVDKQADDAEASSGPDLSLVGDEGGEQQPEGGEGEEQPPEGDEGAEASGEEEPTETPPEGEGKPKGDNDTGGADLGDVEPPADAEEPSNSEEDEESNAEDENTPPDDGSGGGKKKKKPKAEKSDDNTTNSNETKESSMSFGQRFKEKLLAEKAKAPKGDDVEKKKKKGEEEVAPEDQHEFPEQLKKLMLEFPNPGSKMMVGLMFMLGAPLDAMIMKKSELKKSVEAAGDMYMKDSQLRMWVKRVINAIKEAQAKGMKTEAGLEQELTNQLQKMVLSILAKIGMTAGIEKIGRAALRSGVKAVAALAQTDNKVRTNLKVLAEMLGVDAVTGDAVAEAEETNADVETIICRLKNIAGDHTIEANDLEMIRADAARKLKKGWTVSEIIAYCRNQEEVNPDLDEDTALARMKKAKEAVEARLGKKVAEAKNHLGEPEQTTFAGWKRACKDALRKVDSSITAWLEGDADIAEMFIGEKPYKQGKTFSIGQWDGDKGSVYNVQDSVDRLKKAEKKVDEAITNTEFEQGVDAWVDLVKRAAITLGIPEGNVNYRENATNTAIRQHRLKIKNVAMIQRRLAQLLDMIKGGNEE